MPGSNPLKSKSETGESTIDWSPKLDLVLFADESDGIIVLANQKPKTLR